MAGRSPCLGFALLIVAVTLLLPFFDIGGVALWLKFRPYLIQFFDAWRISPSLDLNPSDDIDIDAFDGEIAPHLKDGKHDRKPLIARTLSYSGNSVYKPERTTNLVRGRNCAGALAHLFRSSRSHALRPCVRLSGLPRSC